MLKVFHLNKTLDRIGQERGYALCLKLIHSSQPILGYSTLHGRSKKEEKSNFAFESSAIDSSSLHHLKIVPHWPINAILFRTFKSRTSEANNEKGNVEENTIDPSYLDSLTQKVLSEHRIPPENSVFVRLGVLEGFLLKEKQSSTLKRPFNLKLLVIASAILVLVLFFPSKFRFSSNIFQQKKFKSAEETGMISNVRFKDVGGVDEAKEELSDVVQFLRDPTKFTQLGAKLPKGILLVGPPGTGKTMLARAVAGEAGVPFFYAAGSEFDETFVGVGASRVRQLFENARSRAPSIIFIDEIDACGSQRSNNPMQPYARQTINQLLQEMDGFQENEAPVIVLGATNAADALDKALTRPGRFDTEVQVQRPDIKGRKDLLEIYLEKISTLPTEEVDIDRLASLTIGMSGADISNVVNQGALQAAKMERECVTQEDLEFALDKIRMGPESKSRVRTEADLKKTAYHEAGHALVAYFTPAAWDIYKATIMQRGPALGHVSQIPSKDEENSMTKDALIARIDVAMGGRVAEELLYGDAKVGTGASSDIEQATSVAYSLICDYGMSDKLGLMKYHMNAVSEETKRSVDLEVKSILEESYKRTKELLTNRKKEHKLLSEALIKYETLTMSEIKLTLESNDIEAVKKARASSNKGKKSDSAKQNSSPDKDHGGIQLIPISL